MRDCCLRSTELVPGQVPVEGAHRGAQAVRMLLLEPHFSGLEGCVSEGNKSAPRRPAGSGFVRSVVTRSRKPGALVLGGLWKRETTPARYRLVKVIEDARMHTHKGLRAPPCEQKSQARHSRNLSIQTHCKTGLIARTRVKALHQHLSM